jgi:hypothetical protein
MLVAHVVNERTDTEVTDADGGAEVQVRSFADMLSSTGRSATGSPASDCLRNGHTAAKYMLWNMFSAIHP